MRDYVKYWERICASSTISLSFSSGASDLILKVTLILSYPFLTLSSIPRKPWRSASPVSDDSTSSFFYSLCCSMINYGCSQTSVQCCKNIFPCICTVIFSQKDWTKVGELYTRFVDTFDKILVDENDNDWEQELKNWISSAKKD
jgi:hypothetical protein